MNPSNGGIERLERRLSADPGSKAFLPLAEEHRRAGHLDRAIEILKSGLARNPGYLSAQVSLARVYLQKKEMDKARELLARLVREHPDNLLAIRLLEEASAGEAAADAPEPVHDDASASAPDTSRVESPEPAAREETSSAMPETEPERQRATGVGDREQNPSGSWLTLPPVPTASDAEGMDATPDRLSGVEGPEPPATEAMAPTSTRLSSAPAEADEEEVVELGRSASGEEAEPTLQAEGETPGELPDSLRTLTLARLYRKQGQTQRAARVYRELLATDPHNADAIRELAEVSPHSYPPVSVVAREDMPDEITDADILADDEQGVEEASFSPVTAADASAGPPPEDDLVLQRDLERRRKIAELKAWLERIRTRG